MTAIIILALTIGCAVLWAQVRDLRRRVLVLEYGPPMVDERPFAERSWAPMPRSAVEEGLAFSAPAAEEPLEAEPAAHPAPPPSVPAIADEPVVARGSGFEDVFGRRLPIWAGGMTLAVAGFLIVKYSIDAGLLSPVIRVVCGLLFGVALIAGGEAALRAQVSTPVGFQASGAE